LPLRLPPVVAERVTNQMRQRPRYGNISGEAMRQANLIVVDQFRLDWAFWSSSPGANR
jgi:hypothetical protein